MTPLSANPGFDPSKRPRADSTGISRYFRSVRKRIRGRFEKYELCRFDRGLDTWTLREWHLHRMRLEHRCIGAAHMSRNVLSLSGAASSATPISRLRAAGEWNWPQQHVQGRGAEWAGKVVGRDQYRALEATSTKAEPFPALESQRLAEPPISNYGSSDAQGSGPRSMKPVGLSITRRLARRLLANAVGGRKPTN
jgi:hypothetical protein